MRDNDLVVATRGRGIWILDDVGPLQELAEQALTTGGHLFGIRSGTQFTVTATRGWLDSAVFAAPNPTAGSITLSGGPG